MSVLVKVCGVTLASEAIAVSATGVDFIGFNLWPGSRRAIDPGSAPRFAAVARAANPSVQLVGLFVDADERTIVEAVSAARLDRIQLHGDETPEVCRRIARAAKRPVWKAVAVSCEADIASLGQWPVEAILLDAATAGRGGSGQAMDWSLASAAVIQNPQVHIVLAGGLDVHNVAKAIAVVRPWAVDVASGVEHAPGRKDTASVKRFLRAARLAPATGLMQ